MYPPGTLAGPHEANEDCNIGGYHVPKGTRLIMNVWKLHRDPQVWSDPDDFRQDSTGRRMCPATSFALHVVQLTLSRLLQGFDLSTPMVKPVYMTEGLGIALLKVKPLGGNIIPRLSPELYKNL
ncbi:cytochrome P450 [Tanacetum coccineum]